jgi:hypothetical protein
MWRRLQELCQHTKASIARILPLSLFESRRAHGAGFAAHAGSGHSKYEVDEDVCKQAHCILEITGAFIQTPEGGASQRSVDSTAAATGLSLDIRWAKYWVALRGMWIQLLAPTLLNRYELNVSPPLTVLLVKIQ